MKEKPISVIIDCDPGVDDVIALALAFRSRKLNLLGITTINGNSTIENTTNNAARACRMMQRKIPVYPGAAKPMCRAFLFDPAYCGMDGLCDSELQPDRAVIQTQSALAFFKKTLLQTTEPITIVSIASMTNLAQLLKTAPEVKGHIKEIVTIAGYYGLNPAAGRAEWNILYDPEAAQIVFAAGVPVRALGLDVTSRLKCEYAEELLNESSGEFRNFLQHSLQFVNEKQMNPAGILVDAMAVAAVICPALATYRRGVVRVNPACSDSHLTEFSERKGGNVLAAETFDFSSYMKLFRKQDE